MALEDWITPVSDIVTAWRGTQTPVYNAPLQYGGGVTLPSGQIVGGPTSANGMVCKRRKRQRNILTQANIGIMWQISNLPNNANVRIALAKAIR